MNTLQQTLGKKYGFTPDHTLKLAQSLYEKKYTTYPRTNSEYLSTDIWNEKEKHIESSIYCLYFVEQIAGLKIDKNKALSKDYVDNSKIEDHHAIIPTDIKADISSLNEDEKIAYVEICKRFISIFMEPYKYKATTIITEINNEIFKTTGTQEISKGYKELYNKDTEEEDKKKDDDDEEYSNLPTLKEGDKVEIYNYSLKEGETKPKSRFNVGNITDIMDKYGIGTQATQASIIENILNQRVIEIISKGKKKEYAPTDKGMNLIKLVPDNLNNIDKIANQSYYQHKW